MFADGDALAPNAVQQMLDEGFHTQTINRRPGLGVVVIVAVNTAGLRMLRVVLPDQRFVQSPFGIKGADAHRLRVLAASGVGFGINRPCDCAEIVVIADCGGNTAWILGFRRRSDFGRVRIGGRVFRDCGRTERSGVFRVMQKGIVIHDAGLLVQRVLGKRRRSGDVIANFGFNQRTGRAARYVATADWKKSEPDTG